MKVLDRKNHLILQKLKSRRKAFHFSINLHFDIIKLDIKKNHLRTGIGFFLTVHYNVMTEFALSRWRPRIVAVPAWAFGAGLFALAAWALKDWKNLHLATAAIGVPFLLTYW